MRGTHHAVSLLNVKNIPEVDEHCDADCHDSQDTIDLRRPCTGHECTSGKEPTPPGGRVFTERTSVKGPFTSKGALTGIAAYGNGCRSK